LAVETKFPELGLVDWPFGLVVDEVSSTIWANHKEVLEKLNHVLDSMKFPASRIHLVWGWFGAGKSHSLLHLKYLALKRGNISTTYCTFPESCRSFLDLYRAFANGVLESELVTLYSHVINELSINRSKFTSMICPNCPDFEPFLYHLQSGIPENVSVSRSWFHADPVRLSYLQKLGITKRIEAEDYAVAVMESFVRLACKSGRVGRVLWMIDEFQRIDRLSNKVKFAVNNGLLTFFNRCPKYLSLILSFSYVQQDSIRNALSEEIIDRVGLQELISIPLMSKQEAVEFVRDLLAAYRSTGYDGSNQFFPFQPKAVTKIVDYIDGEKNLELKPRTLLQICGLIVEQTYSEISQHKTTEVDEDMVQKCLAQLDKEKLQ
jgi:hypothetical protein